MMQGSSLISTNPPWKVSISMRRSCSIVYSSVITPIFFVECLADLKECSAARSTPEQPVGSLADRAPECGCRVTVHRLLRAELCGRFNLSWTLGRPYVAGGLKAR